MGKYVQAAEFDCMTKTTLLCGIAGKVMSWRTQSTKREWGYRYCHLICLGLGLRLNVEA